MNTSQSLVTIPDSAPYTTVGRLSRERELTVQDLLAVLLRRRGIVLTTVALCVSAAICICVCSTRQYLAKAELQVQREQRSQLGLDNSSNGGVSSDALQDSITLQTQSSILQSDSLALNVIRQLKLASISDFTPTPRLISRVLNIIFPSPPASVQVESSAEDEPGLSAQQSAFLLRVFHKALKVTPVPGTRLIDVTYLSSNPRIAADVVNRLVQALTDYNFQTRHDATARTARYLMGQLSELRQQSETLGAKVARARRESGIVSLGGVDAQGREQVYSAVLDKLQRATAAHTQAQSNFIAKEALYRVVATGDPEAISNLSGSNIFTGSGADSSLALIQTLRMQQAAIQAQLAEASAKFGPAFSKLDELRHRLDSLNSSIQTEVARLAERAKNDLEIARGVEASTVKIYSDLKARADRLNDRAIAYTILRQEADQSRTLYDTLFKELQEAGILADFKVSDISVVDPARMPAVPAKPNVPLYLAGSLASGLFLGVCVALIRDTLDSRIRDLPELEAQIGKVPLAVVPRQDQQRQFPLKYFAALLPSRIKGHLPLPADVVDFFPAVTHPSGCYTEALRALRTSLLRARPGTTPQLILVTSSVSGEGKSMLSMNLATLLTQHDCKVLLVEGDLRHPVLSQRLRLKSENSLSSTLLALNGAQKALESPIPVEQVKGLHVLPAGPMPSHPADLLGSKQMTEAITAWRKEYAFIIIDGAPVLPVTDSVILSAQADLVLLVARYNVTKRQSLDRSRQLLASQGSDRVRIVLNAVGQSSETYYQYFGYRSCIYYGDEQHA